MKKKRHKFKPGQRVQINATRRQLDSIEVSIPLGQLIFLDKRAGHWENDTKKRRGAPTYEYDGWMIPECYLRKPIDEQPK